MRKTTTSILAIVLFACGQNAKSPTVNETDAAAISVSPSASTSLPTPAPVPAVSPVPVVASASASAAPPEDQCGGAAGPYEAKLRPIVKKCFFEAYKTRPSMSGNVRIVLNVDAQGKIRNTLVQDEKELGKRAVSCMKKAVETDPLDTSVCPSKTIVFAMAFGDAARTGN